jgi:hypothetical protein
LAQFFYVPVTCAFSYDYEGLGILQRSLTVLTRQTRQAVRAINQSIFLRCLCKETHENNNKELVSCSFSLAIGRLVFVRQTGLFEMDQTLL